MRQDVTHILQIFVTSCIYLEIRAAFVQVGDYHAGAGQGEGRAFTANAAAKHQVKHCRDQQRHAEHECQRKDAAEGTGHIFEGNGE